MRTIYQVVVGNVGTMKYTSKKLAEDCYRTYVTLSTNNISRASGESVILFKNDEIIKEHLGDNEIDF